MAFSGSQITRLGLYGGTRQLYGSFAGKAEEVDIGLDAPALADPRFRPAPGGVFTPGQLTGLRIEAAKALPQRGIIRRVDLTPDGQGGYDETVTAVYSNVACRLSPPNPSSSANPARETFQGGGLRVDVTLMLTVPWDVSIEEQDKIWIEAMVFEVEFVNAARTFDTVRRASVRRVG